MSPILITKSTGEREPFYPEKLVNSLVRSGANQEQAESIASHIEEELVEGITTSDIYRHAFDLLRSAPRPVIARYSMRRALAELGPNGFPFEKFVAEIFKSQGYEAITGQIVQGDCVEHEMDVVAWKGDELIMVEAKFHNEPGLKSDLKVALYVKARFDDLKNGTFEYGGKSRKLTKCFLVTNTKFTDHATRYATCQKLSIIGWDYPRGDSLEDWIEKSHLHPLTAIPSLSSVEKRNLLDQGLVLCKQVLEKGQNLASYGIDKTHIKTILEDAKNICP